MKNISTHENFESQKKNFYILAETAMSHEGDVEYLKKLIDAAKKGKADGIKFQVIMDAEDSYTKGTGLYDNFHKRKISRDDWKEIVKYAKLKNLSIIILPIDIKAVNFLKEELINDIWALELHSICFNELPLLNLIKDLNIPIILGVGGRTSKDIDFTLNKLDFEKKSKKEIILMYGFQSFPTNYEKVKISKLKALKKRYHLPLGYADHTNFKDIKIGNELIKYAYLCGARFFEKHLIIEKGVKRVDFISAIDYQDLLFLREELDKFINILGNNDLDSLNDVELNYRNREKQLVAKYELKRGDLLNKENLGYKVTTEKSDYEQKDYEKLINSKVKTPLKKNEVIKHTHIDIK